MKSVRRGIVRWLRRLTLVVAVALVTLLVARVIDSQRGPPLKPWHTFVPDEADAQAIDKMDWAGWLAAEERVFTQVRHKVTEKLEEEDQQPENRYFAGSPINPSHFEQDWNRSYIMEPAVPPRGAVVLLHGLTDAPYSLRYVARMYRDAGFVAIGLRVPAHGTVPAALTDTVWEDWMAATRLAVREARRRVGGSAPLHLVGFSNGGALAMKYALDAIENPALSRPDRLVLISPMIGITSFARFVGFASLPAMLPSFAKAAWLSRVPEFIPFKYNSFPVNGARQSHRLTMALQGQLQRLAQAGRLGTLAPVLTFQSTLDFTVSTRAVIDALYRLLPANGSELVLFDRNQNTRLGPMLRPATGMFLDRTIPQAPRNWDLALVTNASANSASVVKRVTRAGETTEVVQDLGVSYPRDVFSLSHVALPFPPSDSLYGDVPDPVGEFGVSLGALAPRGEVGVLVLSPASLLRISWNPFYDFMMQRIAAGIP